MSTLNAAFQHADLIFGIYLAIVLVHGLLARQGRRRGAMAIAVINHGSLIGLASTLAMPFISPFPIDVAQVSTGIFIELACAVFFVMASWQIINLLRTRARIIPDRYVLLMILTKLLFFSANYLASGGQYGIFSDDSRIDFLTISPLLARTWYLDMMIDFIVLLSVAMRCLSHKTVRAQDWLSVLAIICITLLSGSKGVSFLTIAYVMLFAYAAFPKITSLVPKWVMALVGSAGTAAIFGYVYVLSELLQVPVGDQFSVTFSRFLLSADARIMAFDPQITGFVMSQPHGAFISELFRGPARMLGLPAAEFPIGVYQYQYQVGTTNYVGSTNQLSAMFTIYGGDFWLLEFLVISALVWLTYKVLYSTIRSRKPTVAWVSAASFFLLSDTLCKGFDAFVQLLPISMLVIAILTFLPRIRRMPRRAPSSARPNGHLTAAESS